MKTLIALLLLPIFAGAAPLSLDGKWKLNDRICSSGNAPTDSVDLKQSDYTADFSQSNFKFSGHINHCDFTSDGFFKLEGKFLTLYYVNNQSCRGPGTRGAFKGGVFINENEFSTVVAGFGIGGSCKPNEFLISTFVRAQ